MRTNCIYHRDQLITNFCRDKHCLMPLCPECISEHTQYHEDQRTRPHYATIHEILADVHTQINNCIELLVEDKNRNGALIVNIQTVGDIVREKICAAKELVYQSIEESFLLLEKQINRQLEKIHEQKSVYLLQKSEKQDKCLLENLDELQAMKNTLKGERALSNIIYFMREKQAEIQDFHSQFSAYLHTNQSYQPRIQINNEALHSLDALLARILKVGNIPSLPKKKVAQPAKGDDRGTPNRVSNTPLGNTLNRLKQKHNVVFVESEIKNYSPHISRVGQTKQKSAIRIDGEYEKLSKRVAMMRQENDRLSRVLRKNENSRVG